MIDSTPWTAREGVDRQVQDREGQEFVWSLHKSEWSDGRDDKSHTPGRINGLCGPMHTM